MTSAPLHLSSRIQRQVLHLEKCWEEGGKRVFYDWDLLSPTSSWISSQQGFFQGPLFPPPSLLSPFCFLFTPKKQIGPQNAHAHVYVIVSTKRSKAFQAMGRMESLCKEEPNGSRLRFSIEWLSESAEVPFQDVEHVKQRKNSPFSVTASQDGQEIGGSAGKYLSYLLLKPSSVFFLLSFSFSFSHVFCFVAQEGEESPKDQPNTHTADEFEEGENPRMQEKEIECLHKELKTARVPERFLQCPPTILPPQHPVSKSEIEDWSDFEVYFQEL